MRDVIGIVTVVVAAVVLGGCGSDQRGPGQETSPSGAVSATTGSAGTQPPTRRPPGATTPPTVQGRPQVSGVPRSPPLPGPGPQAPPPAAPRMQLTGLGLGGVPVGSTLKDFARALRRSPAPMNADDRSVFANHACVVRQLEGLGGVGFMVIGGSPDGQVRRISIEAGSGIRTDKGIEVGSSLRAVRALHGPGLDEPFDHFPVGGDAVLEPARAKRYLAFIGDKQGRVVEMRVGFKPEVLSPEGCV